MSASTVLFKEKSASHAAIVNHLLECDLDFIPPLHTKVDIKAYAEKIFRHSVTFEAWNGDALVGLVAAYLNDVHRRMGYITSVSVLRSFRNRGIGSILMRKCFDLALAEKFSLMILEVDKNDSRSIKIYRALGFEEFEQKGGSMMMKRTLVGVEENG